VLEPPLNIKIFQNILHVVFLSGLNLFVRVRAKKFKDRQYMGHPNDQGNYFEGVKTF